MAKEILGKVRLKNVRLSFFHGYEPQPGKVDEVTGVVGEPKYGSSFLIPKETTDPVQIANLKAVKDACAEIKAAKWGKAPPKLKPEKVCLRDGDLESYDGYEGMFYVSSSNGNQPVLVDRIKGADGKWLPSRKGQLYSGCYVNATIHVWAQDNKHGKRLNASLELVQFLRPGDAFGAKAAVAEDEFDEDDVADFAEEAAGDAEEDDDLI